MNVLLGDKINYIDIERFRKLKKIHIDIGSRITFIAGHNGVGKSTILGLIANGSGKNSKTVKSLFGKNFQSQFNEIFSLDLTNDYDKGYSAILNYSYKDSNITKKCAISKHKKKQSSTDNSLKNSSHYLKVVPRTFDLENNRLIDSPCLEVGASAKVAIPTLYIGMSRMVPNGELESGLYRLKSTTKNDDLYDFYTKIYTTTLGTTNSELDDSQTFQEQDIKYSNKKSLVPYFETYSAEEMSLGQDSLSTIITAITSFYQLKQIEENDYNGGILIIDEVDSGLHPYAQLMLFNELERVSKTYNIQIICTTHSLTLIQKILQRKEQTERNKNDKQIYYNIAYLQNTRNPRLMVDPTYKKIKNDMLLQKPSFSALEDVDKVKVYLEDEEAKEFLHEMIMYDSSSDSPTLNTSTINFDLISSCIGSDTLLKLPSKDDYFETILICCDGDIKEERKYDTIITSYPNIFTLPTNKTPEEVIIDYITELLSNEEHPFWTTNQNITSQIVETHYLVPIQDTLKDTNDIRKKREKLKKWWKTNRSFILQTNIIKYWCYDHYKEYEETMKEFQNKALSLVQSGNYLLKKD